MLNLKFKDHQIIVHGNVQEPLFNCQDILIKLLDYKECNSNKFYRENK